MDTYPQSILQKLASIVGSAHLLTDQQAMSGYAIDWRGRYHGRPLAIALPKSQEEVAALVACCYEHHIPIVPQGGNTSTCGGATPDETGQMLVLCMKRMNRILSVDPVSDTMTVEAGVTLESAQRAAKQHQRLLPLALASSGSCQIGGNLSTNAGGTTTLRYGTMRNLVLGIEAVLPGGICFNEKGALRKNTTGLDLKQLLIGAEGTLGIITCATLKLCYLPLSYATAMIGMATIEEAIGCLASLKNQFGDYISTCEIMSRSCLTLVKTYQLDHAIPLDANWLLLIELTHHTVQPLSEELTQWLSTQRLTESIVACSTREQHRLWQWRKNIPEAERQAGNLIKHDIALPISNIPVFLASCQQALQQALPTLSYIVFGHLGDGSLHFNVSDKKNLAPYEETINRIVYEWVEVYQGTIAAEHGIGQLKVLWLERYKNPVALALMRQIKKLLDPEGLMNPHCLYATPKSLPSIK
ncbi:MAG: FAD-binding oxidoreductase [Neisseriales bacterium]|nr:MAG: FAD-binding oxidoreductase [Neisseriales bacterium]